MRTQREYLLDILEYADAIFDFIKESDFEHFCRDRKTNMAVIRGFEIIGEVVKRLDYRVTSQKPEIAWHNFAGFRDILIHAYHRLNMRIVWTTIHEHLPALKNAVSELLNNDKTQ